MTVGYSSETDSFFATADAYLSEYPKIKSKLLPMTLEDGGDPVQKVPMAKISVTTKFFTSQ